jgi:hypothetical protein
MMRGAMVHDQSEALVVQSSAAQDCSQFSHIVNHALISIFPSRLGGSGCKKNSFRPTFDSPALPD